MGGGAQAKRRYYPTPGGQRLQALRKWSGLTLADIEGRTGHHIGTPHLQKIEAGAIKRPDPETLEVILRALDASYVDRRDVLEAFGYKVPRDLPTEKEIEEARRLCQPELNDATYPVYLIDDALRLWAWNRYIPRLIGMHPDDPALAQFVGVTMVDLALNPAYPTTFLIDNPDDFLPMWLHTVKTAMHSVQDEPWYGDWITKARELPGFSEMWDSIQGSAAQRVATHRMFPLRMAVPGVGLLQFRLAVQPFILDPRFLVVPHIPYGATTLRQCAMWAEEEGVL